jgi:hypothetical protein
LSDGEVELLIDGLTDDVAVVYAMIHLGVRQNPPADLGPPSLRAIDATFAALSRLSEAGLIRVGRMEYEDRGPLGRVALVHHIEEPLEVVRARIEDACRVPGSDWEWACWIANTGSDNAARHALQSRVAGR